MKEIVLFLLYLRSEKMDGSLVISSSLGSLERVAFGIQSNP